MKIYSTIDIITHTCYIGAGEARRKGADIRRLAGHLAATMRILFTGASSFTGY